jgi:hypothetical protein
VAVEQQSELARGRVFDLGFVLAVAAMGWGLSLATYRAFAAPRGWPMGEWQAESPLLPAAIGAGCILLAIVVANARIASSADGTGWVILLFGIAWAVFWTGFLRVGAQSALLLAPGAAVLLLVRGLS